MLPGDVQDLAAKHRIRQQLLAALATSEIGKLWRSVDAADATKSWATVAPRALVLMAAAQSEAARGAQQYVSAAISGQGATPKPAGTVSTSAFTGVAADGRPLDSLLGYPAFEVSAFVDGGMARPQAQAIGGRHLKRIVATEIADASRVSTGVAIANDRSAVGYVRALDAVTCSRCVVLASYWYGYRAGFARHPFCSCAAIAAVEHVKPPTARSLFDAMTPDQLTQAHWSKADVAAINGGAGIEQATNAIHELRYVSIAGSRPQTTLRSAARRGDVGQRSGASAPSTALRITPEALYAEADRLGWSRDETINQLKHFGFIL